MNSICSSLSCKEIIGDPKTEPMRCVGNSLSIITSLACLVIGSLAIAGVINNPVAFGTCAIALPVAGFVLNCLSNDPKERKTELIVCLVVTLLLAAIGSSALINSAHLQAHSIALVTTIVVAYVIQMKLKMDRAKE